MREDLNRLRKDLERLHGRRPDLRPLKELTDQELWAVIRAGHPELPADLDQVPDGALAGIAGKEGAGAD